MRCGVGCRRGSYPELLWLWHRPVATSLIRPLAWEPPYAAETAQENGKKTKKTKTKEHTRRHTIFFKANLKHDTSSLLSGASHRSKSLDTPMVKRTEYESQEVRITGSHFRGFSHMWKMDWRSQSVCRGAIAGIQARDDSRLNLIKRQWQ